MDIDASISGWDLNAEEAERVIAEIASINIGDGTELTVKGSQSIMDDLEYPGIRVLMTGTIEKIEVPMKIDISTGDVITPRAIEFNFPIMLEDREIRLWTYNLETVLAEKVQTILIRGILNTRMRDFYDVHCLASIKKLVYDDKTVSAETMIAALKANWAGYEDVQKLCLEAPKYGNNIDYVDEIAARLYNDYADLVPEFTNLFNNHLVPSGISITSHAPAGAYTGPTPDGRKDGETFADGSTSPVQGTDKTGPLSVFESALKLPQDRFMATLLNMKISPSSLKTESNLAKLGDMIRVYLTNGGKHVQFNVVDSKTLVDAKASPEKYGDLIVRVAGYSAYFTVLTNKVQDEIIHRTEHEL